MDEICNYISVTFNDLVKPLALPLSPCVCVCVSASTLFSAFSQSSKEQHSSTPVEFVSRESQELRQ